MKTSIRIAVIACICQLFAASLWAQSTTNPAAPTVKLRAGRTVLGVSVTPLHPVVAANLPGLLNSDQGLVVERVVENSPAARGGIKVPDILLMYDDQKLFSEEQLAKLVHSDRPGRDVTMQILRAGKLQTLQVTLGEWEGPPRTTSPVITPGMPSRGAFPFSSPGMTLRPMFPPEPGLDAALQNFASLNVKKLPDNKFRIEADHLDEGARLQKDVFEGTPEEIHRGIEAAKDLKPAERALLHRILELHSVGRHPQPPGYRPLPPPSGAPGLPSQPGSPVKSI